MTSIIPTNRQIELVSETEVGQYWFSADGNASATLGEKGGAVFAPILEYKITSDNSIELFLNGKPFDIWTDIQVGEDTLHVSSRGRSLTFKVIAAGSR